MKRRDFLLGVAAGAGLASVWAAHARAASRAAAQGAARAPGLFLAQVPALLRPERVPGLVQLPREQVLALLLQELLQPVLPVLR